MAFDESLVQDVLKHADIVKIISSYLSVTKKGKNYVAICPFHDDSNPSLTISPEKKMFKCFVCGTGGSAITFVQKYEHISFFEALKKVADLSGFHDPRLEGFVKAEPIDNKRTALLKCLHDLTLYYQYALNTSEGKDGLNYFESRNLNSEMRSKFLLGYAFIDGKATCDFLQSKGHSVKTIEDTGIASLINGSYVDKNKGRVIFPICDKDGNVIGFSARRIKNTEESKYINSPETYLFHKSNVLYNYHIAKEKARISGYVYVCEGFMDVFALAKIGIDSAVALMGVALTNEHIEMLRRLNVEIRMCLDGDKAGQQNTMKACNQLQAAGLNVRVVDNQNSTRDPDEILNEDGPDALRSYLNNLVSRMDFALNYYKNTNPLTTSEDKNKLVKYFIPLLLSIRSQLDLDSYIRKLSTVTGYEIESLRALVEQARSAKSQNDDSFNKIIQSFHPERKALRRLELAEREFLFQMINNQSAVTFYESKISNFYDSVYRQIANFIIDYTKKHSDINANDLIVALEMSELENKEELIKELSDLSMDETFPSSCSEELLTNLLNSINEEKNKIFENDLLESSLKGKSELEQARIIAEFNRRKMKK